MTGSRTPIPTTSPTPSGCGWPRRRPETSSHVETELQQLAARRLDNASTVVRKRRSLRGQRKATTTGAFDSPQGFVFIADA